MADSIKRVEGDYIITTLDREKLYRAETPQVFQYDLIAEAHRAAENSFGYANATRQSGCHSQHRRP